MVSAALIAVLAAGLPVYVYPKVDRLQRADAIVVLGGYGADRFEYGMNLAEHGWAPTAVLSVYNPTNDAAITNVCEGRTRRSISIVCFTANPLTTLGEARELRRLAAEHNWHRIIVVTARSHISRARYIVGKCFAGEIIMVPSPMIISRARWVYEYFYQTAGYIRTIVQPGC
ncbi:YdcF family protein [Mycobacterium sp. SM3041]|uniref:YdcF family protein n=1 Tax=Mycobacterium sp. SM3041 TaxID=3114291 RepID=UPI0032048C8E